MVRSKKNSKNSKIILTAVSAILLTAVFFILVRQEKNKENNQAGFAQSLEKEIKEGANMIKGIDALNVLPVANRSLEKYSKETIEKLNVLDQILASKNDNDERMDTVLKKLTAEDKKALIEKYGSHPAEARNERGTIVFLIGRNLEDSSDFEFFSQVLNEKPCMSLANCNVADKEADSEHVHSESSMNVTLNYPQVMVLQSVISSLRQNPNPPADQAERMKKLAADARRSGISVLVEKGFLIERLLRSR